MDAQNIIARRVAQEIRAGMLVNLGIGIPTLVANHVPAEMKVFFQSENGLIGTAPVPETRADRSAADRRRRTADQSVARRMHVRQRDLVRADPWRSCRHDGSWRLAGRRLRQPCELDDSGQVRSRHGRGDGPRHRRKARDRRDATRRQRQVQSRDRNAACRAPRCDRSTSSSPSLRSSPFRVGRPR